METFGYNKRFKRARIAACFLPVFALLTIVAQWVVFVLPGDGEFKWWTPLAVIAFFVWALLEIAKYRESLDYSVAISEDSIRIRGDQAIWEDVLRVEFRIKNGLWNEPAIVIHTKAGSSLAISSGTDSLEYVKGFVEGHTKRATFS